MATVLGPSDLGWAPDGLGQFSFNTQGDIAFPDPRWLSVENAPSFTFFSTFRRKLNSAALLPARPAAATATTAATSSSSASEPVAGNSNLAARANEASGKKRKRASSPSSGLESEPVSNSTDTSDSD